MSELLPVLTLIAPTATVLLIVRYLNRRDARREPVITGDDGVQRRQQSLATTHRSHGFRRLPTAGRFPWLAFLPRLARFLSARLDIASFLRFQSSKEPSSRVLSFSKRFRARAFSTSAAAGASSRPS